MVNRIIKIILLSTIIILCSCGQNLPEELTVSDILHDFNWLGDEGHYKNEFEGKPFLQKNKRYGCKRA